MSIAKKSPLSYDPEDRLDAHTNAALQRTLTAFPQNKQSPSALKTKLSNISTSPSWPKNDLTNLCDPLGFIKGPSSTSTQQHLVQAINSCLETPDGSPSDDNGNTTASQRLAWSFLRSYGMVFWGDMNRKHLREPDSSKGLLYPRDAGRLSNALEMVFRDRLRFKVPGGDRESSKTLSAVATPSKIHATSMADNPYKPHKNMERVQKRKEDASSPLISRATKPPTKNHKRAGKDEDDEDDNDLEWNHLLPEILEEKLRPMERKSMRLRRYTNTDLRGTQSELKNICDKTRQPAKAPAEKPRAKRLQGIHQRLPTSQPTQGSQTTKPDRKYRSKGQDADSSKTPEESSETDSDTPLVGKRRRALQTPVLTPALTEDKDVDPSKITIVLDSNSEDEHPSQKSQRGGSTYATNTEHSMPRIKVERGLPIMYGILSQEICQKTTLLVITDNEKDKAPIAIALAQCKSSDGLFDRLVRESELPNDLARKVKSVSATYKWNGRRLRLRRHNAEDWQRFQKEIKQGWESGQFGEECEVEMMVHIGG